MSIVVHVDRGALTALGLSPTGPVFRSFVRLGAKIDALAKLKLTNDMVNVRTGNLRSSQQPPVVTPVAGRLVLTVANAASYAKAVHDGTRAHQIVPRAAGGVLTGWQYAGQPVFTPIVHHPGTKARPWLHDATREALASF